MNDEKELNSIRQATLKEIDQADRRIKYLSIAAALVEGSLLVAFLYLMDFSNKLHWLILIAAGLVYLCLAIGLVMLGSYFQSSTRKILRAIFELGAQDSSSS